MATEQQGRELKVTLVKSAIGSKPKTRGTLRALGLRRINSSNVLPDLLSQIPAGEEIGRRHR